MGHRVLVADDSRVFRLLETEFLVECGFDVVHACDGAEALRVAITQKPDLVLLDVQMPVMDGVQVLAALKANPLTREIPVIIVTTIGREHDEDLMRRGGANDFLSKPINGSALLRKVRALLAQRPARPR